MKFDEIKSDLVEAMSASRPKTSGYDTQAEVVRVDGNTAWVHIPGGVDETPVALTIAAKEGDTVQVRVSGGAAWLVGNASAPPTDDGTALAAQSTADEALSMARATIRSTTTYYKISYSGTDPDDVPYRSTDGEDTRSPDGEDERITTPIFEWQKAMPDNVPAGMFLWTRIEIKHNDGSVAYVYSVTEKQREVFKETTLWYLSTSSSSLSGGSWSETLPAFVKNRYYWKRTRRVYTDNTVDYTDPVLDSENNSLDQEGVFNRLTNNGAAQGLYIDPSTGDVYINASYIMSGAFVITDNSGNEIFRADKDGKIFRWDMEYSSMSDDGDLIVYDKSGDASIQVSASKDSLIRGTTLTSSSVETTDGINVRGAWLNNYNLAKMTPDGLSIIFNDITLQETFAILQLINKKDDSNVATVSGLKINGYSLEDRIAITSASGSSASLTKPSSLTNFSFGTTWTCSVRKNKAGVVTVHYNFNGYFTATSTTGGTLFTLPSGYRPAATMYLNKVNQSGTRYLLTLNTSGTVTLQNTSGASASSAQFFRDVITFVTA